MAWKVCYTLDSHCIIPRIITPQDSTQTDDAALMDVAIQDPPIKSNLRKL